MERRTLMNRLEAVLSIVPKARAIGDIGTDHGYLAVELIRRGTADSVIAGDIHEGPLASALQYVKRCGLGDRIDCRLGDGLRVTVAGELTGAVCCGMGGFLMRDIIDAGPEPLEFYVLQPQNGQRELRQYIVGRGYVIVREIIVYDTGKLYTAFLAVHADCLGRYKGVQDGDARTSHDEIGSCDVYDMAENPYTKLDKDSLLWSVGALLERRRPPLWREYIDCLIYQRRCVLRSMGPALAASDRYRAVDDEIGRLRALR